MSKQVKHWQDADVEAILGNLLRWGVILSSTIVLAGGIIYLLRHGGAQPDYHSFHGIQGSFHDLSYITNSIAQIKGQAIIQLGIVLLIATPIARIIFSVIGFALEKDRLYIIIGLVVLGIIITSTILGIVG